MLPFTVRSAQEQDQNPETGVPGPEDQHGDAGVLASGLPADAELELAARCDADCLSPDDLDAAWVEEMQRRDREAAGELFPEVRLMPNEELIEIVAEQPLDDLVAAAAGELACRLSDEEPDPRPPAGGAISVAAERVSAEAAYEVEVAELMVLARRALPAGSYLAIDRRLHWYAVGDHAPRCEGEWSCYVSVGDLYMPGYSTASGAGTSAEAAVKAALSQWQDEQLKMLTSRAA